MKSQFFRSATSNMLSQFSRDPRELPWQPNSGKISQNCTNFRFLQEIEEFFPCLVGFYGLRKFKCAT